MHSESRARREFLKFLAGSPLFAHAMANAQQTGSAPPATPAALGDMLSIMDFEEAARKVLPPAHWGYMATGVDDDLTLKANRAGFQRYQLRARRLVDVSKPSTATQIFGNPWEAPIFVCPVGGQKMFHPEGEVAVAKAARAKKATQILSTQTSYSIEDVAKGLGSAPWYQLYMPADWNSTEKMIRRVEAAGSPVLVWTVDLLGGRNTETATRFQMADTRKCETCHTGPRGGTKPRPMFDGIQGGNPPEATWSYVERLKKFTKMKLVIKGIDTAEDARLSRESGADAVLVSNHGGRATETLRSTIEALPEVVDAVGNQIPVFVDGGFRRGTDIYKALALGAKAVGVGRPYVWALSAFGQTGVEKVLEILRAELTLTMRQCGTPTLAQISRAAVMMDGKRL
jgi:4-hydroxymandelate oxidase